MSHKRERVTESWLPARLIPQGRKEGEREAGRKEREEWKRERRNGRWRGETGEDR